MPVARVVERHANQASLFARAFILSIFRAAYYRQALDALRPLMLAYL
jgi:hypothetical protein